MKILVIDDEKPTLSMFKLFLTAYGYEVYTAESGEQGLETFEEVSPDIVFTDIRMPGIDGLEVLARIRQAAPGCQVIIITGHGDMERAVEALDLDASDFINKPVERQALNAALIRAEKRVMQSSPQAFTLDRGKEEGLPAVIIRGKLTASGREALETITQSLDADKGLLFQFDPHFSIDREGIALLMELLQTLVDKGLSIKMTGLSYNYLKFFEMAGVNKLAGLEAADTEEPGL